MMDTFEPLSSGKPTEMDLVPTANFQRVVVTLGANATIMHCQSDAICLLELGIAEVHDLNCRYVLLYYPQKIAPAPNHWAH